MQKRKMLAPNISNAGYNAQVIKTTYGGNSNSIKAKATALGNNNADDDAATAIIQNPLQTETTGIQQDAFNNGKVTFSSIIKENLLKLRELSAKLEGRLREVGDGIYGFKDSGVLERLKKEIEAFNNGGVLERLRKEIEAFKDSDVLERLKKEIEAIIAFEGFLLGVHKEIDEYTNFMQFRLKQILDVEHHMAEINRVLELGIYTVARMRDDVAKALRGQANTDPDRALHFLKDT